jgi:hypothetical protein
VRTDRRRVRHTSGLIALHRPCRLAAVGEARKPP